MTDQSTDILGGAADQAATQQPAVSPATQATTATEDPYKTALAAIKNEDGLQKYASVEDVLSSVPHREEFISTLKAEKQAIEQQLLDAKLELEKRMSVQDAMSQIASTPNTAQTDQESGLRREDVYSLMKEYESAKSVESNRKSVSDALIKHYGDEAKAQEILAGKLSELGMSREQLAAIAGNSPKAASQLLGLDSQGSAAVNKTVAGNVNPDAIESSTNTDIPKSKGIMLGASGKDLINEWRNAGAEAKQELGI